jgi:HAE1 family hydrophobic/amphiphilic exporter-1/multidrug efflux pump
MRSSSSKTSNATCAKTGLGKDYKRRWMSTSDHCDQRWLVSVFVPSMSAESPRALQQFAATIAISVTVSGFAAHAEPGPGAMALLRSMQLFMIPALRSQSRANAARIFPAVGSFCEPVPPLLFGVLLVVRRVVRALRFLPEEDQGYFIVVAQLPDGASKQRTDAVLERIERYFQANPAVHSTDALSGQNFVFGTRGPNAATMFVPLVLWDERPEPQSHAKALVGAACESRKS